jgi:F-type H+-transporting ATPase subunit a
MLETQPLNTLNMYVYIAIMPVINYVLSPLDQFEIRDLLSLNISLLNNTHISLTNIGLYLSIGAFIILTYSLLASNENKIIPNN